MQRSKQYDHTQGKGAVKRNEGTDLTKSPEEL